MRQGLFDSYDENILKIPGTIYKDTCTIKEGFNFVCLNMPSFDIKKIEFKRDSDIHIRDISTYTPLRHIMTECLLSITNVVINRSVALNVYMLMFICLNL